jgi:uncharacterized phage infection (PIP) family protein YhgE
VESSALRILSTGKDMSEESIRDRFLQAEEEASQLIDVLSQLRSEMERYREARESLAAAVEATQSTANALIPISVRMKEFLLSIDELGFVQLRDDLTALGRLVESIDAGQEKLVSRQSRLLDESRFLESVRGLEQGLAGLGDAHAKLQKVQGEMRDLISQANETATKRHYMVVGVLVLLVAITVAVTIFA